MAAVYFAIFVCCSIAIYAEGADNVNTGGDKKVVCYYTNWSYKRMGDYGFTPDKVDPFLCTHIIYAFIKIINNNLVSSDPEFDLKQHGFVNMTALKKKNKNLKVMIGVGGWVTGTKPFVGISANDTTRKDFAQIAVRFMRGYMFDGMDLNWQHPGVKDGGTDKDRENYVLLAQTLREEFALEAGAKNKPRLLLSISIANQERFLLPGYDIVNFNRYVDFISVICYDYHFSYEEAVNHHSPLYSLEEDSDYNYDAKINIRSDFNIKLPLKKENYYNEDARFNINYTIHYFMERADPAKLVLGIPTYGRTYKLFDPDETTLGSSSAGPGDAGPFTGEKGHYAYFEICNFVKNENWTVVQPKKGYVGPYAYRGDQWVGYDDMEMMRHKAAYAKEKGLGGVMFWTIDFDDFLGKCQDGNFPLIRAAKDELLSTDTVTFPDDANQVSGRDDITPSPPVIIPTPAITQPVVPNKPDVRQKKKPSKVTPAAPRLTPAATKAPVPPVEDSPELPDVSEPQSNIVDDLVRLIQKAGGMNNFFNILRNNKGMQSSSTQGRKHDDMEHKKGMQSTSTLVHKHNMGNSENSIVFESPNLPPIMVLLSNSSIYIKEINVFHKS